MKAISTVVGSTPTDTLKVGPSGGNGRHNALKMRRSKVIPVQFRAGPSKQNMSDKNYRFLANGLKIIITDSRKDMSDRTLWLSVARQKSSTKTDIEIHMNEDEYQNLTDSLGES